ncbi:hypothetical protein K9M41_00445 [Candidatus Gracilibacteria bacterium]|nr:hypothetical protein [Candidatus Gracilibacteria bacterium]
MKFLSSKIIFPCLLAFLATQFLDPTLVWAAGTDVGDNDVLKGFAQLLSILVNIFTFLSLLFLNYGGDLLGTEFLTADTPMEAIRPMWVIMRNITNIGFVLVLLFLAFSNLFNFGEGGNWTIKEKLPKIIFSLIAINFSLLGFRVLIDAVHVGTITILSIPQTALETKGADSIKRLLSQGIDDDGNSCTGGEDSNKATCQTFRTRINDLLCNSSFDSDGAEIVNYRAYNSDDCLFRITDLSNLTGMDSKSLTAHNLFLAFGVFFQKLEQLPALAAELDSWSGVITNVLFSGILALAYVVALIAVFIALLLRMVVLWIAMVFAPILVAAGIMGFGGQGGDLGKKVITNLIMPLKIAAAFAVSFIMISSMIDVVPKNGGSFFEFGAALNQFGTDGYGLLWQITTIVVFWAAAFWALQGSEAEGLINNIKSGAQKAGTFLARAATIDRQVLMFPGKDGKMEKASMAAVLKLPDAAINQGMKDRDIRQRQSIEKILGIDEETIKFKKSLDELTDTLVKEKTKVEHLGAVRSFLKNSDPTMLKNNNEAVADALLKYVEGTNLSGIEKTKYVDAVGEYKKGLPGAMNKIADAMSPVLGVEASVLREEFKGPGASTKTDKNNNSSDANKNTYKFTNEDNKPSMTSPVPNRKGTLDKTISFETAVTAKEESEKIIALNVSLKPYMNDYDDFRAEVARQLPDILKAIGITDETEAAKYVVAEDKTIKKNP